MTTTSHRETPAAPVPIRDGTLLSLRRDALVQPMGERIALVEGHARFTLPVLSTGVRRALDSLAGEPVDEESLFAMALDSDGDRGAMAMRALLWRLDSGGWLEHTVVANGRPLARLVPLGHRMATSVWEPRPGDAFRLSRFAVVRRDDNGVLAESALVPAQVRLIDPVVLAVLGAAGEPTTIDDVSVHHPQLGRAAATALTRLLIAAMVLRPVQAGAEQPSLRLWSVPDLLFHVRSRIGRHEGGYGATHRWQGLVEPVPAIRPSWDGVRPLPRADLEERVAWDPPFGEVMRVRRSVREHDDERPITVRQLAELLQRVAMVRSVYRDGRQELSIRSMPSGGAIHELEIYPLVSRCVGVEPGLYHYDAGGHGLARVREPNSDTALLAQHAKRTAVMRTVPQVVLLIAARFDRVMWKYESMAYALTLKHVGVLYEALYLTATAMGLACCGLDGGDSDTFALVSGLDQYQETTVGEFLVGSGPQTGT